MNLEVCGTLETMNKTDPLQLKTGHKRGQEYEWFISLWRNTILIFGWCLNHLISGGLFETNKQKN